jgi:hypothetical protein
MNLPFHFLGLRPAPAQRDGETVHVITRTDVQWGGPIFKAPALPTPHQLNSDLPFSVNFCAKTQSRRRVA